MYFIEYTNTLTLSLRTTVLFLWHRWHNHYKIDHTDIQLQTVTATPQPKSRDHAIHGLQHRITECTHSRTHFFCFSRGITTDNVITLHSTDLLVYTDC